MLKVGEKVWTYHSTEPTVIGPLTVREVDKETGMCVASSSETTMRLYHTDFAKSHKEVALRGKVYYNSRIRAAQACLDVLKEKVKKFIEKEGI